MFLSSVLRSFLVVLFLVVIGGCSGSGSSSDGPAKGNPFAFNLGSAVNLLNQGSVNLGGLCVFDGSAVLRLFQEGEAAGDGSTPPIENLVEVDISCTDGEWSASGIGELATFDEGNISVELLVGGARLGPVLTLIKDIQPPLLDTLSKEASAHSWSWTCDQNSDCFEYRVAVSSDATYDFPSGDFTDGGGFTSQMESGLPAGFTSNGDEDLLFHVQARDRAGNLSTNILSSLAPFRLDNIAPSVSSASAVSSNANDAFAKAGDVVTVEVLFDDPVQVDDTDGTPKLQLSVGESTVEAEFAGVAGAVGLGTSHAFSYSVAAGHNGGLAITGLISNGGSVRDSGDNDLAEMGTTNIAGITVDNRGPSSDDH